MSQYLNIFLKSDGKFIPIGDYSRSTYLYDEFCAPYGKICEYKADGLREVGARLESRANDIEKYIQKLESLIALIPNFQGQEMEEKIAAARSTLHLNKAMCFCKMEQWRDAISDVCLFPFSLYASVMWS